MQRPAGGHAEQTEEQGSDSGKNTAGAFKERWWDQLEGRSKGKGGQSKAGGEARVRTGHALYLAM